MIAFVSIFLGLTTGHQTVELDVSNKVAAVEIRLDEQSWGTIEGPPWTLEVDFSPEIVPRRLTAIARDDRGVPLDVATQWLNVPRPAVETELLLDDWKGGVPRRAKLLWHTFEKLQPLRVEIELDGRALSVDPTESFALPPLAADELHFLSAHLEMPNGTVATAEAIFGGAFGSSVRTELTAVPLVVDKRFDDPASLDGWLTDGKKALEVVALGDDPAEVVLVRDEDAKKDFERLRRSLYGNLSGQGYRYFGLREPDGIRAMSAVAREIHHPHMSYSIFPNTAPMTVSQAPLPEILSGLEFKEQGKGPQRLIDAVAVAGLRAASSQRRRAVLLVTGDCAAVDGQWSADTARRYLERLHVPFFVWTVRRDKRPAGDDGFCTGAIDASGSAKMMRAVKRLRKALDRQQIVWLEGRHLPNRIALTDRARGVALVE